MTSPFLQLKRNIIVCIFLIFNQICFAQTQITDLKYENIYSDSYSLIGKVNNTVFYTQLSQHYERSVWYNTIGDSTTKFIGTFPDINFYNFSSYIFNNRVYFLLNKHPFSSELWTCDATAGSLRQIYQFDEVGSIFIFNNQMLFRGKGLYKIVIDEANKKYELNTLVEDLTNINFSATENFIICVNSNYSEKAVTIIDKNLEKHTSKFPTDKTTNISSIRPIDGTFIVDATITNSTNSLITEQYIYDITRKEFRYLTQKTGTPLFESFYFSDNTLNHVELYGTEKNYTILRSEITDGKKIEKINKKYINSLTFYSYGFSFYSNFEIINDNLHFIGYTFDSTNRYIVKDKYLECLNLKTGVLDSYLVNEISKSPYPSWDYGYNGLLFSLKQEGEILKISPRKVGLAPILGFNLKQREIVKFDTLSQPFSQSISVSNNQFLWIEKSSLYFLDTLKRSTRIVRTFQEKTYNSAIASTQIVNENLFLLVRSFENEFSIHHFDGDKLQKIIIRDSVQYFHNFSVSNKLSDNSHLLYFYYKGIDNNRLAIYHFNSLTKQMRFITTFVNSDFASDNIKEVFTVAGKYFFKKGYYQNVVVDFTDAGTKILPQLNKQDFQDIVHVSANGNVLVRERETLSLIRPPYNSSTLIGRFSFSGTLIVYEEKVYFFSDGKVYIYENEKIRIINGAAYISGVTIERVSNDEIVLWDFWSGIYQVNLKTEKVTQIYESDARGLYFHKRINNEYLFTIYNQSDGKNKLLVYDSEKLTTKVVLSYNNGQNISAIGSFTDQFVWSMVENNTIIDHGIYKDGIVKKIENSEISVFDKNQQFEIIYSPNAKEFRIYDLTFGSGVTKVPVKDNLLWVESKQRFGTYYAISALGRYSDTNDNFSRSLWVTDGSTVNTIKIADRLGFDLKYIAIGSKLYFTSNNDRTGNELWETDGTSKGTRQIADIWEGTFSSFPENLMKIGKYLYCFATTPKSGKQLWRIKEIQEEIPIVLGNEEMIEKLEINVYPNPATNFLNIKSNTLDLKDAKIELFDLMGKKVQEMSLENENRINLTNLPSGIYSLKIILDAKKYSIKVVKF